MRVGVIWVGFQCEDLMDASLSPWIKATEQHLAGHDWMICCVHVPFVGFEHTDPPDNTHDKLVTLWRSGVIGSMVTSETPVTETWARGRALTWLVERGCTHTFMVDADEMYTVDQISTCVRWVDLQPFVAWWRVPFKNYVFDDHTYLAEPFMPPRIHEARLGQFTAAGFWDDNNVLYRGEDGSEMKDTAWSSMTVPLLGNPVRHLSWLSNNRSKAKVAYQSRRPGWECSFRWDEKTNSLAFNEAYHQRRGLPLPTVLRDPS